jgi:subtilisin family serine protease
VVFKGKKMRFQILKSALFGAVSVGTLIALPAHGEILPLAFENEYVIGPIRSATISAQPHSTELARWEEGFDTHTGGGLSISRRNFNSVSIADTETIKRDCDQLLRSRGITNGEGWYCEPNYLVSVEAIPQDPLFQSQKPLSDLELPKAWDITTGSSQVTVAILDTGIDYTHEDLAPNMWKNTGEIPENGIDDDENGFIDDVHGIDTYNNDSDPMDDNNHGTHCAGIVGAVGDNSSGGSGVNWDVRLMALKFIGANGSGGIFDAIRALEYGVENGADIINASFGTSYPSALLRHAIEEAGEKGVLFVAAAGNSARDIDTIPMYPAAYDLDNIISVGAEDQNGNLAWFSNYGEIGVDLVAPGEKILSTVRNGGYQQFSGTSMAAPHVSGVAALLLSKQPEFSFYELKTEIMETALSSPAFHGMTRTSGILSAYRALAGIRDAAPVPDTSSSIPVALAKIGRLHHTARATRSTSLNGGRVRFIIKGGSLHTINLSYTLSRLAEEVQCAPFPIALNENGRRGLTLRLPRKIRARRLTISSAQAKNSRKVQLRDFYPQRKVALTNAPELIESCQILADQTRIR